jgi:hypothetical protein
MDKKAYSYKLTLEGVINPKGEKLENEPLNLDFQNHDDLFKILELSKSKTIFKNSNDNTEFFLGLKLLSEVLLRNRNAQNPMTDGLSEAVAVFMKKLKGR